MQTAPTRSEKRQVTLADVARLAGTAKSTASMALNGNTTIAAATREAVLKAARELDFTPSDAAQRLSNGGRNNDIAMFSLQFDLGCGTQKVQGIQRALNQKGFRVPFHGFGYMPRVGEMPLHTELLREVCRQKPRCLIYNTQHTHPEALEELRRYIEYGGMLVTYDGTLDIECDQVRFDQEDSFYVATKHLLELGHRRIGAYQTGRTSFGGSQFDGFCRALGEYGLVPEPQWLFPSLNPEESEADGAGLAQQFLELPRGQRPTAICVQADHSAISFLGELNAAGVEVPDELSVVGQNDRPLARYATPPLTTVTQPVDEIVRQVVEMIESRLNGDTSPPRCVTIRGELVQRATTAPPQIAN